MNRLKAMWATSASDRSEDYLVSEILMSLVGKKIKAFLDELKKKLTPKNLKELLKLITPPKRMR